MIKRILGFAVICYYLTSCKPINPSIMFKTPKDYVYDAKKEDSLDYRIAPNDRLSFRLFTNNGMKLVNFTNESNLQQIQPLSQGIEYLVEYDGKVNLPTIGRVPITGKTIREAEFYLEDIYDDQAGFVDPFIILNVTNRRVTVFPGNGGNGIVITLQNNNVTLLEALALAGGIREDGRADRVKLVRGDLSDPEVYFIDLSTIDGLQQANIVLQANDIIYVEPIGITTRQLLSEFAPVLSFATSLITLFIIIDRVNN